MCEYPYQRILLILFEKLWREPEMVTSWNSRSRRPIKSSRRVNCYNYAEGSSRRIFIKYTVPRRPGVFRDSTIAVSLIQNIKNNLQEMFLIFFSLRAKFECRNVVNGCSEPVTFILCFSYSEKCD